MSEAASPPSSSALANRNVGGVRRRAQAPKDVSANRPNSTRAAGAGGSSNTMLRIYTDDNKGLSVDPVVVLVLAISFVFSVVMLHIIGKLARWFYK
ncbi:Pre protein translocase Sec Sec61-beta subunit [Microstroma glucosiphilum]|uniref:Protein transport protein Sec61 subunit beta n=1 Tax=Pseudomicrostroma glucosiphilum TaxID=1684307 RepID=A0A316UBX9_9BASI|nr:Pre protein translocase Sec Sec61-beta subunit [Pseudomicrostroma glucosiphilum]PWN22652.1 Pre protein translocase Sec Sec61-beta subunit [Pseudomicrostroma glucosiphilum]